MRTRTILLMATVAVAGACSRSPAASRATPPHGSEAVDPTNFVATVDNPYFPLRPGTTFVYEGVKDGQRQREEITVARETKVVMGVTATVLRDTATRDGVPLEVTEDWYAQDREGNVWYFGEDTAEYEHGKVVSREGSWQAGVDGARPGIIMQAHPRVPSSYRQEYYRGHAEDMAWVVSLDSPARVPLRSFPQTLLTLEWNPLEPGIVVEKSYAAGVGLVSETALSGPAEGVKLVSVTPG